MKRALMVGMSVATAAAMSLPALVLAQDFPPPPPSTYYGTVSGGAVAGQGVIAIVESGNSSQTCGDGRVLSSGAAWCT
jgi:CRISPR/Cas system-associated protein Cas5 (RAMP superfamily)